MEVSLENLLTALDFQPKGIKAFLNLKDGKIISERDPQFKKQSQQDLIPLPAKNELDIMWYYCDTLPDEDIREELKCSLAEQVESEFEDKLYRRSLADDWYRFRDKVLRDLALDWCVKNKLIHA